MSEKLCLDKNYSTTRLITEERPVVAINQEDALSSFLFLPTNAKREGEGGLRTKGYFKQSYQNQPLITVVTVVYNGEEHLEQTIQSVIHQSYDNVEYIIVDGASSDGTLDIIKKYEEQIDYWVSERDGGIYDAMNKGISLATGEYIIFMNADDWFMDGVLEIVANSTLKHKPDFIYGDLNRLGSDGKVEVHKGDITKHKKYTPIGHQALFVKSEVLRKIPFDTQYRIMADYDMMIKLIEQNLPHQYIEYTIATFKLGGISSVDNYKDVERFQIQYKNFGLIVAIIGYIRGTKQPWIHAITSRLLQLKKRYEKQN